MNSHTLFMQRCLDLALNGLGNTAPNPMVGAVIVHDGKIIGEGFHKQFGFPHAEVEAVNSVKDKSLLKDSTICVSLEPCCHFGKTPPCTSLIIDTGIKNIVIACTDPNPKVAGEGIRILQDAGIHVIEGVLKEEAEKLNIRFFTFHRKKRPYIILKWAQSADHYIDPFPRPANPEVCWISNAYSKQLVHKWRAEESGILIGRTTAMNDNPTLTTREWPGKNPVRILIDPHLKTPINFQIFNGDAQTICYFDSKHKKPLNKPDNIEYIPVDTSSDILQQILASLFEKQIQSVIVEGGLYTINKFLSEGLWDEARVIEGMVRFGKGTPAPVISTTVAQSETILEDTINYYYNYS
jgi:diaminohydroxyphosphoribosylaminopyrimidine deaminase / 5-amino-6-(5-phosphoribosylamino)uracil reductase